MPNDRPSERRGDPQDVEYLRFGRFRIRRKASSVRIHDVMLKCVGFVGEVAHETASGIEGDLCGTGFLVSVGGAFGPFYYFVTAKHIVGDLNRKDLYILINKMHGGIATVECKEQWWTHPADRTADVAVTPFPYESRMYCASLELSVFATPEKLRQYNLGVGDEVYTVGLFSEAPGEQETVPMVRHGNVAMMPKQQIQTAMGYADVYLIEARSIGGISGSPVFIRQTLSLPITVTEKGEAALFGLGGSFCLGLMHGHWDIKESEMNSPIVANDPRHGVNMGIAIVVPAIKIVETLNRQELVAQRQKHDEDLFNKRTPSMD